MHDSIPRKTCSRCKQSKPVSEFHKHKGFKDGLQYWCKPCLNRYNKDRLNDPLFQERRKEYFKQWHLNNLERRKKARSERESKRWKTDKGFRSRKARNKRDSIDKKYQSDPEWVEKYRGWGRTHSQKRRAIKAKIIGSHTQQEWIDLCNQYGNLCLSCGQKRKLTLDHVVPVTKGGSDSIDNIQPLCGSCNSKKSNRVIDYRPDKKGGR